jgi:hypothetical protein
LRFAVADAGGNVGSIGTGVSASLGRLGPFLASDVLTSWNGADGKPQFLALEEVPVAATGLRAFLELYSASTGPLPANVRVQWSLLGGGAQPVAEQQVIPVNANDRLRAAGQFALDTLPLGTYELRATVIVDGTTVGTVSTSVRKTQSPSGRTWVALDERLSNHAPF